LGVETAIAKLKKYKSSGNDQIPAELMQAGGKTLVHVIHMKLVRLIKMCLNKTYSPHRYIFF
jgi:hypothetical protein